MIEILERERYALKMTFVDVCSNQVADILYGACVASQKNAVKILYQMRFSEAERAAFERMIGSEEKVIELIIDESDNAAGSHELDQVIEAMKTLSLCLR